MKNIDIKGQPVGSDITGSESDPERVGDRLPNDNEDDTDDGDQEYELHEEILNGQKIVDAFLAAQESSGRDRAWLDAARFVCESMYDFKLYHADGDELVWNGDLVEQYMFDHFPEKVTAGKEMVARTPELITAFIGWMGTIGRIKPRVVRAICKRVANNHHRFLREANNPHNFGIAKSVAMAMLAAGVDPTNQSEAARFLADYNERILGDQPAKPLSQASQSHPVDPSAKPPYKRWVWSGEGLAPDPYARCPCGSGKRYRKCCKPR